MTVRLDGDFIRLEGDCRVEEAELLLNLVQQAPGRAADLTGCRSLHGALAQVLLSFAVPVTGAPDDPFLCDLVIPALGLSDGAQGSRNTNDHPAPIRAGHNLESSE